MFWDKFQNLCNSVDKSPNKVAAEIGIASGTLTNWKQGGMPRWAAIDKVCDYFGVTRDFFFPPETKKPAPTGTDDIMALNALLLDMTDEQIAKLKEFAEKLKGGE